MVKPPQDHPQAGSVSTSPSLLAPALVGCLLALAALGCRGGGSDSIQAPTGMPVPFLITPAVATVVAGQTSSFSASSSTTGTVTWKVEPATGGTITAAGLFTAASSLGQCQISAQWRPTDSGALAWTSATAIVSVVAQPLPAVSSSNYTQASGTQQSANGTALTNASVVGEAFPAALAASANQTEQLRDDFLPPEPSAAN
jgi:hypothetical protein